MGALLEPIVWIVSLIVDAYLTVVIVEVALHWLLHFKVIEVKNKYAASTVGFLSQLTEPVYKKIRAKVPVISGIDVSPFILMVALLFISRLLFRLDVALM